MRSKNFYYAAGLCAIEAAAPTAHAQSVAFYNTHCSVCHQAAGVGAAAQFPRLAGRVGTMANDPQGRAYLVHVIHNGLSGPITVDGAPLTGVMPPQSQLTPNDIAQILNYLLKLQPAPQTRPKPFRATEVAPLSASALSRDELLAERHELSDAHVIP